MTEIATQSRGAKMPPSGVGSDGLQAIHQARVVQQVLANGTASVLPEEVIRAMAVGINMGNTLEAPVEGEWRAPASESLFDAYLAAGFRSVRVPVRWDNHTARTPPYSIDAAWLDRVAEVVGWSTKRGLVTIVNSHHDTWLDDPAAFEGMLPRFEAIWRQVGGHTHY